MVVCSLTTKRVQQWCQNGRFAHRLHLFDKVCNLVNGQGDVITLATPDIGAGPFTMIIEGDFTSLIAQQAPITIDTRKQILHIGRLSIDMSQATEWQARPQWVHLQQHEPSVPPSLTPHSAASLHDVVHGITTQNSVLCQAGAYALAGYGPGLTPAGDDMLMGVLYGLQVWAIEQRWSDLIVATAVPRTTTLSGAFLMAAAAGEASIAWHNLANGHANAIEQILAIGHTSGADAWAGFCYTHQSLAQIKI